LEGAEQAVTDATNGSRLAPVEYRACRAETDKSTFQDGHSVWHARAIVDGAASTWSACGQVTGEKAVAKVLPGAFRWVEEPLRPWEVIPHGERCHPCATRVADPIGEDTLWGRSSQEKASCCIVCRRPMRTGPWAVLSRRRQHGAMWSTSGSRVHVHKGCVSEGEAMAQQEGSQWLYPPPPGWDHPRTTKTNVSA